MAEADLFDRALQRNLKGLEYFAASAPVLGATPKDVLIWLRLARWVGERST